MRLGHPQIKRTQCSLEELGVGKKIKASESRGSGIDRENDQVAESEASEVLDLAHKTKWSTYPSWDDFRAMHSAIFHKQITWSKR